MTIETIINDLTTVGMKAIELVAEHGSIEMVMGACVGFIGYAFYRCCFVHPRTYCGL